MKTEEWRKDETYLGWFESERDFRRLLELASNLVADATGKSADLTLELVESDKSKSSSAGDAEEIADFVASTSFRSFSVQAGSWWRDGYQIVISASYFVGISFEVKAKDRRWGSDAFRQLEVHAKRNSPWWGLLRHRIGLAAIFCMAFGLGGTFVTAPMKLDSVNTILWGFTWAVLGLATALLVAKAFPAVEVRSEGRRSPAQAAFMWLLGVLGAVILGVLGNIVTGWVMAAR